MRLPLEDGAKPFAQHGDGLTLSIDGWLPLAEQNQADLAQASGVCLVVIEHVAPESLESLLHPRADFGAV